MKVSVVALTFVTAFGGLGGTLVAGPFETDIMPILKGKCAKCHLDGEAKGDLALDAGEISKVIGPSKLIRPGDPEETAGAFAAMIERKDGPTALFLTRQNIATLSSIPAKVRREGVLKGGYIAKKESGALTTILLGTGSELQHAMKAAEELGGGVRVVSMPCFERFDRQSAVYREEVLPAACTKRIAIEAGVSGLWWKYVGTSGAVVGIDRFGISAPGDTVMSELGMTAANLVSVVKGLG